MRNILPVIIVCSMLSFFVAGCTPDPVKKAGDTLTLHYIDNKIYYPVSCKIKEVDDNYYVFCTPGVGKIGGLYLVKYGDSGQYQIFTVNGKAAQHAKKGLGLEASRIDQSINVSKIIDNF